jgi:hypothetical protein
MKDKQMVQTFLPHTPQEAFTDGIGAWSVIRGFEKLDVTGRRHPVEIGSKLAVVIMNQILGCLPIRSGYSQLLGQPGIGRRSCHADMDHLARLQFDEEEGKERSKEQISNLQEVACPDLRGVVARDRSPTFGLAAGGCEPFSCTSEWFACRHECLISIILPESFQHRRRRLSVAICLIKAIVSAATFGV